MVGVVVVLQENELTATTTTTVVIQLLWSVHVVLVSPLMPIPMDLLTPAA